MRRVIRTILTITLSTVILFCAFCFVSMATPVQAATSLKVQIRYNKTDTITDSISAVFKLINTGSDPVDLADVKIRYYYTINGEKTQNFWCDHADIDYSNVEGTFTKVSPAEANADYYVEVSFNSSAGKLAAGNSTELYWRISKADWTNYTQTDDYSFNTNSSYMDSPKTPVYQKGTLIYGVEPDKTAPVITHTPVSTAEAFVPIPIDATITDSGAVTAGVYYGDSADGSGFTDYVSMTKTSGNSYTANIPEADGDSIYYYIKATDSSGNTTISPSNTTVCNRITINISSIHDIKAAAVDGQDRTIKGTVTCVDGNFYYIQEPDAETDADPNTSEGIAVYYSASSLGWNLWDQVTVKGTTTLIGSRMVLVPADISDTSVDSSGNPLPSPQDNTIESIGNSCEGMRVRLQNVTIGTFDTSGNTPLYNTTGNAINIEHIPALAGIKVGDLVEVTAVAVGDTPFHLIVSSASDVIRLAGDTTPPSITAITPSGTDVPISTTSASVTFDEVVKAVNGKEIIVSNGIKTFTADAGSVMGTSWAGKTATILLTSFKDSRGNSLSLDHSTAYSVTIPSGAFTDIAGLEAPLATLSFTTEQEPLTPSATPLSLTVEKGGTGTITIDLGQGISKASTASVSSLATGILSAVPDTLTSSGTITVSGLSVGTGDVQIVFNDPLSTVINVSTTVSAIPPVWPVGSLLTAVGTTCGGTTLNWTAAQDAEGVTGYRIYKNGSQIAEVAGNIYSYVVGGLNENTAYTFRIQACNADRSWTSDGPDITATTLSSSSGYTVIFYNVSSQAGEGGSIYLASSRAALNSSTTFTVTPYPGYQISDVWVNGVSVGSVSSYELKNITSDIIVKAFFIKAPVSWSNPFADVDEKDWFYDAVAYSSQNGLFHGTGPNLFNPGTGMTRAMFVTVLANLEHVDITQSNCSFTDISQGSWYTGSIAWAARNGIVSGVGQNRFAPDQMITRQEMATILYKYAKHANFDVSSSDDMVVREFIDGNKVSDFAATAMSWAVNEGLISGKQGNVLDPKGAVTRAEAALLFQRFVIRYAE